MSAERELIERLLQMPLSTEDIMATWSPPEWEEIATWWDQYVEEARKITGKTYRGNSNERRHHPPVPDLAVRDAMARDSQRDPLPLLAS